MNVLFLHRTQGEGVERVHIDGVKGALERRGFKVTMVCPSEAKAGVSTSIKKTGLRDRIYKTISQFFPELLFEFLEIAYNAITLTRSYIKIRSSSVDVIYERFAFFAVGGAIISRFSGIPLVVEVNYSTLSGLVRRRSRLLLPLAAKAEAFVLRRADVVVAVSSFLVDQLTKEMNVDSAKILLSPNAVEPMDFDPSVSPLTHIDGKEIGNRKVIGFVGGFYPWHGLDLLVRAFAEVSVHHPDSLMVLVGDGPEKSNIEELVSSLGHSENVVFMGRVAHADLPRIVGSFSVGVMPDSNEYGSPMKIFEYMAMSKTVVVPDYPPLVDVIRHNENGIVFERQNLDSLSQALISSLSDPELRNSIGSAARQSIEDVHNWDNSVAQMLQLLEKRVTVVTR